MPQSLQDWLAHIERLHARPVALGLERVRDVAQALGIAPRVPVITVGGTNGKGSTCALLERMLQEAGYRVGLYTSPHLLAYNERVRIDGRPASDEALCQAFAEVEAARGGIPLTYFEFGTLAAWQAFARAGVEAVILEVGLGGRLDAVNVIDADCAVVTTVDLDHQEYLGATREAIGFEKAGIFRPGRPAIVGDPAPPQSLLRQAELLGADLRLLGRDFGYHADAGQWTFWSRRGRRGGLAHPALRGRVQLANASVAIAALEALAPRLPVAMQDIRRGLATVELAGRFQVLPGRPAVVLEVAHNPQAAGVLADNLAALPCPGRTWAVFGMLADKDVAGFAERLRGRVDHWLPCGLPGARGLDGAALARRLADQGLAAEGVYATPAAAWRAAKGRAGEDDRIVVCGSFLTVAGVLQAIDDERQRRTT